MIRVLKFILSRINMVTNYLVIKENDVKYSSFPYINGKLLISNKGEFSIGKNTKFNSSITSNYVGLNKPCTISVGEKAILNIGDFSGFSGVSIYCSERIDIGKYVNFGGNTSIWDTDFHPLEFKMRRNGADGTVTSPITIGDDVFIGANSIILKGVNIGNKSIVGAGSVVTKSIPNSELWAGNPAKFIRKVL